MQLPTTLEELLTLVQAPRFQVAMSVLLITWLITLYLRKSSKADESSFTLGGSRKSRLLHSDTGAPKSTLKSGGGLTVVCRGLPSNPPRALAAQLQKALGLAQMPVVRPSGADSATVHLASAADARKAVDAGSATVFGKTVSIAVVEGGPSMAELDCAKPAGGGPPAPALAPSSGGC
jgi:hypothetical protein